MSSVIIYNEADGVVVLWPSQTAVDAIGLEAIAAKDVPAGKPYSIIDSSEVPTDRDARLSWTVPDSAMSSGVGADYGVGSDNSVIGWDLQGNPVISHD